MQRIRKKTIHIFTLILIFTEIDVSFIYGQVRDEADQINTNPRLVLCV